jgi:Prophage endopeptidase tail
MGVVVLDTAEQVVAMLENGDSTPGPCPYWGDLHTESLEGVNTYEFLMPGDHDDAAHLVTENLLVVRNLDNVPMLFRIKETEEARTNDGHVRSVYAESADYELAYDVVRPTTLTGLPSAVMATLLTDTRYAVGRVDDVFGSVTLAVTDYTSTVRKALFDLAAAVKGEVVFRHEWAAGRIAGRYVDLVERRGSDTGIIFETSHNAKGITRHLSSGTRYTAMVGVGKADTNGLPITITAVPYSPAGKPTGQDWVGSESALAIFGLPLPNGTRKHIVGVYSNPDQADANALTVETWNHLQQNIADAVSYTVDALALERVAGYSHERVRLGDTISIRDTGFAPPLVASQRIREVKRSYADKGEDALNG